MKKCPTCGKEFEDSMKFCQIDGAELVADEPAFDPYATVVGHKLDLTPEPEKSSETTDGEIVDSQAKETPSEMRTETPADTGAEPIIHETTGSVPIAEPDEVLEMPGSDPLKTMYVSESELKEVFGSEAKDETSETPTMDSIESEPPASDFGSPPPSPFSVPETPFDPPPADSSPYAGAEAVAAEPAPPFQAPEPAPVAEWDRPAAPDAAWPDQPVVSSVPVQSSYGGEAGQSQGLAIGSLVCGILSCTICCSMGILLGPAALLMGFMAKKKAEEEPAQYGGRGLALGGMITGAVGVLFGIGIILYYIIVGFAVLSGGLPN